MQIYSYFSFFLSITPCLKKGRTEFCHALTEWLLAEFYHPGETVLHVITLWVFQAMEEWEIYTEKKAPTTKHTTTSTVYAHAKELTIP